MWQGMRVEVCPDKGRAMRASPLQRQAQRFACRHSQPPIEFPCSAPQRDGKFPKRPAIRRMSVQVVLTKSDELQTYKQIAGIENLIDDETSADDAAKSKPHPDIFKAALGRLGVAASEAIVVGDSPHNAQAAGKIGLRTIGVLCGGFPEADLRKAGCIAINRDYADLLRRFDPSVLVRRVASHHKIYPAMLTVGLTIAAVIALVIYRRRD